MVTHTFIDFILFFDIEYALTDKVHLVSKADWLLDATSRQSDFVRGPRVYFGFMFCH